MKDILENHPLFKGINKTELEKLLKCLSLIKKSYKKDEYIIHEGNQINFIGLIISGRIFMEKEDYAGNIYFYTEIHQDNLFGEVFICPHIQSSTVNYRAATDCTVLFIKYDNILHLCKNNCRYHQRLNENLVNLLAYKCRSLMDKIEIISKKTIRERILAYLLQLSVEQSNPRQVTSPFNHKEMASFLCVNRSSMLRELHKMKEEHLLDFKRNMFHLYFQKR